MITIVNYGSGNISAITNIYDRLKIEYAIAETPQEISIAKKIILPGVGAYDETMSKLNDSGLRQALDQKVLSDKAPVLGICVGMQILANSSEEGEISGLGWIDAVVKKIDTTNINDYPKIPHLGWNSISIQQRTELFEEVNPEKGFYFLHSYYFSPNLASDILATTKYGKDFVSAVKHNNIFGTQFHPEKSHSNGISLLKNFATKTC